MTNPPILGAGCPVLIKGRMIFIAIPGETAVTGTQRHFNEGLQPLIVSEVSTLRIDRTVRSDVAVPEPRRVVRA